DVSVRADNYTRAEALQRLFALSLRIASAEKLAQRIIGKWIRRLSPRDRLCGKHCHNTRRDLFHDGREGRNNSLARLLRLLRCDGRHARLNAKHRESEQRVRPQNFVPHKEFACTRESEAQSL